jgi:hypothetical protein
LNKKEVSKLTVIENNEDVIEYNRINNPDLCSNIEIVYADASEYEGSCDTLLLDHYEFEDVDSRLLDASRIRKNIDCDVLWVWELEDFVSMYRRPEDRRLDVYEHLKTRFGLDELPEMSEELLRLFCFMFNAGKVSEIQ